MENIYAHGISHYCYRNNLCCKSQRSAASVPIAVAASVLHVNMYIV